MIKMQQPQASTSLPSRVLVVDDDSQVRLALSLYLEHLGVECVVEGHVPSALERLEAADHGIGVMTVDCTMPRSSGGECAELALERSPELGVIYMSGFDLTQLESLEADSCFLKKPFSLEQLSTRLVEANS